ncbi:hypothetical protein [uncultured Friedmanniella sp.]|uniref:hypothetical protein n=1 Tax=uncultured Friedmanniella sp. TaxID=335381 RepID=UPI0035C9EC6D
MVDPDPGYRPRRAWVEPEQPASEPPAKPDPPSGPTASRPDDRDAPPPLFRDEVGGETPDGATKAPPTTPPAPPSSSPASKAADPEETRIVRPLNFRQRRLAPAPVDEGATTLLPRTDSGSRRPRPDEDEDDDQPRRGLLGRRGRTALLASALVAVIVVGAAIIYAVTSVGNPTTQVTPSISASASASGTGSPTADPSALLADTQLLTPAEASDIDDERTWKVALTQRGAGTDAPTAACLTTDPVDGQPTAQQQVLQLLSSSGKSAPSVLHQAAAYASPEDAAQAYALAAKAFGGCAATGSYISGGATVSDLGDQSAGLVVNVSTGGKTQWHSIVLSRTGRVLNILDAAQPGDSLPVKDVAAALATITTAQCQAAGGTCTASPQVTAGPPPLGGDVPGFLATGDLPPAGNADESWVATPAEEPTDTFLGSQCETVTWSRTGATTASTRVYLVASSAKFGLNDIVLTMKDEQAATAFAEKIRADLKSCSKRQLTATVTDPAEVSGIGASGAKVSGWTATVSQKSTDGTQQYRVGIVSSGSKVAYTFLNSLPGGYDLTGSEWDTVAVRAGQRMTQTA